MEVPFYSNGKISLSGPEEVIRALSIYEQTLSQVECLIDKDNKKNEFTFELLEDGIEHSTPETFQFKVVGKDGSVQFAAVQLRQWGVPTGRHNTDREFDAEARINFLLSPVPIDLSITSDSRKDALSFRLDREGKTRKDGNIITNNPAQKDGEVSLEIGSGLLNLWGGFEGRFGNITNDAVLR